MPVYRRERLTRNFSFTPPSFDADAQAVINAMSPAPDAARQQVINALVVALKASTNPWAGKLGVFYIHAAHASQPSLLNWKAPAGTVAVATNSPTFTADRGYNGDGVAAFVDTQIAWNAVPFVAQDSAHIGWYGKATTAGATLAGLASSNAVSVQRVTSLFSTRLNNTTPDTVDSYTTTAGTHLCASRGAAGSYARYIDAVAGTASAQTSAALATVNLAALRVSGTYGGAAVTASALHAGSDLTAAEVSQIQAAIQAYMVSVGAN